MRREEFLDLLENNLQALILELENCKKDDVDFLFEIDQDGNTILHDVVRSANNAPNPLYLQLIKLLLKNGAKTHIVNYAYESVLTIATTVEIKKLLFANRTIFTKEEAKHWVRHFLLNQKTDDEVFNIQFLNEIVGLIAGVNFHDSLGRDQSNWVRQLSHLVKLKGSDGRGTNLEGTHSEIFLSFRMRAILQMIVEMEIEQEKDPAKSDLRWLDLLYQELITEAEMIHVYLAVRDCKKLVSPQERTNVLYELSRSLSELIININQAYSFPLVFPWEQHAHALYINIRVHPKNSERILIRIDNLGLGINGEIDGQIKHQYSNSYPTELYPYCFSINKIDLQKYLQELTIILLNYLSNQTPVREKEDVLFIYRTSFVGVIRELIYDKESVNLRFEAQIVGNCVAAGHQIGLKSRLQQEKYFKDFCEKELETLMKLRNPAVRVAEAKRKPLFHGEIGARIEQSLMPKTLTEKFSQTYLTETQMNLEKLNQEGIHFHFVEDNIDFNYQYTQQDFNKLFEIKLKQNGIFCEVVSINHEIERLRTVIHQLVKNKVESQTSLLIALQIDSVWSLVWLYKKESWMIKALTFPQLKKVLVDRLQSILIEQKEDDSEKILVSFDNNCVVDMLEIHRVEDSGPLMIEIAREFKIEEINQQSLLKFDQNRIMVDRTMHAVLIETQREQTTQLHKEFENLALIQEFSTNKTKVLVTGQAGYGKSRFCQYLLEMSDTQQLRDFKQIFWVKLRYVGHLLKDIPQTEAHWLELLAELLIQSLPAPFSKEMSTWWFKDSIVNSLRYEKVLFMFDGVDELTDTQQITFSKLVSNLQDKQFCLVTTRPQFVHYFSNFSIYKLQSLSFSEVYQFVDTFFAKNLEKSNEFKVEIQRYHSWRALVVVPFHLELLCNLFLSKAENEPFPETLTEVYQKIFVLMLKRAYQKKHGSVPVGREKVVFAYYDQAIKLMERLAFDLICKGVYRTQVLTQAEKALIETARQDINDIGMLYIHGEVVEYMFQSFCEFLCARYISKNLYKYSEVMNVFIENKYHPKFARIWPLVAGLVSLEKPKYLNAFWDILSRKPWDLVGEQFIPLLMSCLEETKSDVSFPHRAEFISLVEQAWEYIKPALIKKDYQLHWLKKTLIAAFAASPRLRDEYLGSNWLALLLSEIKEKSRVLSELNITVLDQDTLQGLVDQGKFLLTESSALVEAKKQNKLVDLYMLSQKLTDFLDILEVFSHLSFFPEQLEIVFSFIESSFSDLRTYNGDERYSCVHVLKKIEGCLFDLLLSQEIAKKQQIFELLNKWANPDSYQNDPFGYPFIALAALETLILKSSFLTEQQKLELFVMVLRSPAFSLSRSRISTGVYELMLTFKTYGDKETEIVNLCLLYNCPARFLARIKINNALNERNLFDRLIRIAGSFAPRGYLGGFPYKEDRLDALYGLEIKGYLSNHLQDPEIALQTLNALLYGACKDNAKVYVRDSACSMILNSNTYILALFIDQIYLHYFPESAPARRTIFEDQVPHPFRDIPGRISFSDNVISNIGVLFDKFLVETLESVRPSQKIVYFKTEKFKKVPLTPTQLQCVNTQLQQLLNTQRLCLDPTEDQRRRKLLKDIREEIFVNYTVSPAVSEENTPTSRVVPFPVSVFPVSNNNRILSREEMLQIIDTPASDPSRYKLNQVPFKDLIQIFLDTTDDRWLEIINNRLELKGPSFFPLAPIQLVWSTDNQLLINDEKIFLTPNNLDLLSKLKEFIQTHFEMSKLPSYPSVLSEELPKTFDGIYKLQPSMAFFRNTVAIVGLPHNEIKLEQSLAQQEYISKSPARDYVNHGTQRNNLFSEKTSEIKIFIPGLEFQPINGDGHCLYNAVGMYLGKNAQELRQDVARMINDNMDEYRDFILTLNPGKTIEEYLRDLEHGTEWADNLEISVLMRILNRPIVIIGPDNLIRNQADLRGDGVPIFVAYNGHNHYDGLILSDPDQITARQILENLLNHLPRQNLAFN